MVIPLEDIETGTGIEITGTNVEVTPSMRAYVVEKVGKAVRKHAGMLTGVRVHLSVEHNRAIEARHKCEVSAQAGKMLLRSETRSSTMYAAIDEVEDRLARVLRKYKERRVGKRGKDSMGEAASGATSGASSGDVETFVGVPDDLADLYEVPAPAPTRPKGVVRRKKFSIPTQSVDDALLCLEYMQHDFYMFRNEESNEISLVYRRKVGGFGLIEPMKDTNAGM